MKKLIIFITIVLSCNFSFAQQGINYKALIKDDNGDIIVSQTINVRFTIIADTGPTDIYAETHTGATTDTNGILILTIGNGTTTDVFTDIDWSSDTHSLKVEIDIEQDGSFIDMGTTQFMAVPYALSSGDHPWSKNENGVNSLNNNVGINRENPEHTLDVRSMSQTDAAGINLSNSDKTRNLRLFSGSETFPDPSLTRAPGQSLLFATFDDNTFAFDEQMRISSEGNVGIGVSDPEAKLDVAGGDWNLEAGNPGDLRIGNEINNFRIGVATDGDDAGITRMYTNNNDLILGTNNTGNLIINQNGLISAPSMTNTDIENAENKVLVTKEYVSANTAPTYNYDSDFIFQSTERNQSLDLGISIPIDTSGFYYINIGATYSGLQQGLQATQAYDAGIEIHLLKSANGQTFSVINDIHVSTNDSTPSGIWASWRNGSKLHNFEVVYLTAGNVLTLEVEVLSASNPIPNNQYTISNAKVFVMKLAN